MKRVIKLLGLIYLFILSIELIKHSSVLLAPSIKDFFLQNIHPIKAISVGWFTTAIAQSSGAVGTITATFAGNNLITLSTAVYILIGASLGTTITALVISLVTVSQRRKDFRHGFEIGLAYSIYSALLLIIVFILEHFFKFFSKTSLLIASFLGEKTPILKIPNLIEIITSPIINILFEKNHTILIFLLGFAILIFALKYIGGAIMEVLGGEKKQEYS